MLLFVISRLNFPNKLFGKFVPVVINYLVTFVHLEKVINQCMAYQCNMTVSFSETAILYPWLILALYLHTLVIMFRSLGFFLFWRKKFFHFWFIEKKPTLRQKILIYITLQTFYRVLPKCILMLFIPKNEAKNPCLWIQNSCLGWPRQKFPPPLVLCMLSMFQLSLTTQTRNM